MAARGECDRARLDILGRNISDEIVNSVEVDLLSLASAIQCLKEHPDLVWLEVALFTDSSKIPSDSPFHATATEGR